MDTALRPMSTSQVLDRTFFLYRKNFSLFAGIALVTPTLTLAAHLVQLAIFGMPVNPNRAGMDPSAAPQMMQGYFLRAAVAGMIGLIVYTIGYAITTGATVRAVSMLHLGRPTTIKESYQQVRPIWGRLMLLVIRIFLIAFGPLLACYALLITAGLLLATLVRGSAGRAGSAGSAAYAVGFGLGMLVVFVAMLAGIVWAVIAYCRYALAVPACAIEGLPVKYAIVRSKFLTKGNMGRVFAVFLLTLVITVAVGILLQIPIYMSSGFSFRAGLHFTPVLLAWTYASEFIGALFAGPIGAIAMALLYYDERVRKEAFDLQLMMEAMKPAGSAAQTASV
jgi:uncharacterized membrane protein